jgi:hypothetical protein
VVGFEKFVGQIRLGTGHVGLNPRRAYGLRAKTGGAVSGVRLQTVVGGSWQYLMVTVVEVDLRGAQERRPAAAVTAAAAAAAAATVYPPRLFSARVNARFASLGQQLKQGRRHGQRRQVTVSGAGHVSVRR